MDLLMHCMALYFRAKCPQRILRTTTFHCFCSSVCRLFVTLKTAAIFLWVYRGFREKLDHQWFFQRKNLNCTKFLPFCSFPFGAIQTLCHTHLHRTLETYFKLVPKQLCVEPPPSAHNMTLSAFAAERRTSPTPQMCTGGRFCPQNWLPRQRPLRDRKTICGQS